MIIINYTVVVNLFNVNDVSHPLISSLPHTHAHAHSLPTNKQTNSSVKNIVQKGRFSVIYLQTLRHSLLTMRNYQILQRRHHLLIHLVVVITTIVIVFLVSLSYIMTNSQLFSIPLINFIFPKVIITTRRRSNSNSLPILNIKQQKVVIISGATSTILIHHHRRKTSLTTTASGVVPLRGTKRGSPRDIYSS